MSEIKAPEQDGSPWTDIEGLREHFLRFYRRNPRIVHLGDQRIQPSEPKAENGDEE